MEVRESSTTTTVKIDGMRFSRPRTNPAPEIRCRPHRKRRRRRARERVFPTSKPPITGRVTADHEIWTVPWNDYARMRHKNDASISSPKTHSGRSTRSKPVDRVTSYTRAATTPSPVPTLLCPRPQRMAHPAPASALELVLGRYSCPRLLLLLPRRPAATGQARQLHTPSSDTSSWVSRSLDPWSVCPYMRLSAFNPIKEPPCVGSCELPWRPSAPASKSKSRGVHCVHCMKPTIRLLARRDSPSALRQVCTPNIGKTGLGCAIRGCCVAPNIYDLVVHQDSVSLGFAVAHDGLGECGLIPPFCHEEYRSGILWLASQYPSSS